jgi:GH25 family lysozyme M1 (1,4-beta-N-acetylmuramidase)
MKCKTALYTNLYWEKNFFDNETLNDFEIWYADYEETPQTPYHFTWWQYSETGSVPGIKGEMDLNLWIKRVD